MGGVGFLPLFGGPGYEHAVASGLITPAAAAIATAIDVSRDDQRLDPLAAVARGVLAGLAYAGVSLLTAILHGARVGICEWRGALYYFVLTAGVGSIMGGAWGAFVGEWVGVGVRRGRVKRRRLLAVLLALAGPIFGAALSLWRFHASPMIFAFDPFVGYFSGTLYDTVIDGGNALLTYRLGSLATLVAFVLAASVMRRTPRGWAIDVRSPRALLAAASGLASLAMFVAGAKLGHMSTPASIRADLGAEKHGVRCDVVYPSTTREQEANLLVKDCDEQVAAVERRLGTRGPARIRAWFFRDADDKKRLMGAAHTYIAKPWREEVYLQLNGYPNPVLGHELAHVIAGSFGRGPFRIAGAAGGWLPNPGLIEGVAVFASPDDEDLTDLQWAHAMMRIGLLPSMQRVFSFGFLGDSSAKSYTLAGAFIEWVARTFGIEKVHQWYGGADIAPLTGKSWAELDEQFRTSLEKSPLPKEAEDFARAKFTRPGIFGRRCPHVVDAIRHEADVCRDSQRYVEAIEKYERALQKDGADWPSRLERAKVMRRHHPATDERGAGKAALEAMIADEKTPRSFRDRADEALADAELLEGDGESAARRYDALAARSIDEDAARTLEVKAIAARDPLARPAITALLLGDEKHGPDIYVGGVALGQWEASAAAPLSQYLIGRNMISRGFYEKGAISLDAALSDVLPSPRIERETLRQRAIAACALKDKEALALIVKRIEAPSDPFIGASGGRRDAVLRMIDRCAR
jgi:hypothetical protein